MARADVFAMWKNRRRDTLRVLNPMPVLPGWGFVADTLLLRSRHERDDVHADDFSSVESVASAS